MATLVIDGDGSNVVTVVINRNVNGGSPETGVDEY